MSLITEPSIKFDNIESFVSVSLPIYCPDSQISVIVMKTTINTGNSNMRYVREVLK